MKVSFTYLLFIYHLIFFYLGYNYSIANDGDAYNYWHLTEHWTSYIGIGTDVIKLINYPFAEVLKLPFWLGFLIYNLIGYCAILELYRFAQQYIKPSDITSDLLLKFIVLLPNLHFWTSLIGKEPIIFLSIVWIIVKYSEAKYYNVKFILGWLLLVIIRPHVAMFLLLALILSSILSANKLSYKKMGLITSGFIGSLILYILTLKILLKRNPFDVAYILERNNASLIAFKRADSYVPMIDYNIFERFFSLNFRPLFFDSDSWLSFISSTENFLILILLSSAFISFLMNSRRLKFDTFSKISLLFFLISSLFFIQRYSCLGIFVRTKIMYVPFLLIAALQIITQSKTASRDGV